MKKKNYIKPTTSIEDQEVTTCICGGSDWKGTGHNQPWEEAKQRNSSFYSKYDEMDDFCDEDSRFGNSPLYSKY